MVCQTMVTMALHQMGFGITKGKDDVDDDDNDECDNDDMVKMVVMSNRTMVTMALH